MTKISPIIVTGIPRSGTSIVAGVLNFCGAFGGDMRLRGGKYENGAVQSFIETPYLESIGADPTGQYPLPGELINMPTNWEKLIRAQFIAEGYTKGPWVYKSARASLLWRIWAYTFPDAKWIIVRRRTGDVVQSCLKTAYMTAFKQKQNCEAVGANSEEAGWLWWINEYEKRFVEMISEGLNCKVVWPEKMVLGDYRQIIETIEWVGLSWKNEALAFVDPLLWTSRVKERRIT